MSGTYDDTGAINTVTITISGEYTLTAVGASGGSATGAEIAPDYTTFFTASAPGGEGAEATGTFLLEAGDVLDIAVGGAGVDGVGGAGPNGAYGSNGGGGGGGGSFIILQSGTGAGATYTPLLVAGGGGGAGFFGNPLAGENAQAGENGGAGDYVPETAGGHPYDFTPGGGAAGGTNGDGGDSDSFGGSGGGGFFTNGSGAAGGTGFDNDQTAPTPALSGGQSGDTSDGSGGFGGGGGASNFHYGGGGGGYSGGGGGYGAGGGGGGSYVASTATNSSETGGVNTGAGSVTIDLLCFLAGSGIATPRGEVPVETLRAGDLVCATDGRALPVRWLGRQTVALRFADPLRVLPIRVRAGALGERQPLRDLLLSPDHALGIDGILIQAGALVNGISVVRETDMPAVFTYYHVELAEHALVFAEGVPAETFVDHAERMAFDNWAEHAALHGAGEPIIEMDRPRAKAQRQVPDSILARLAARAAALFGADAAAA